MYEFNAISSLEHVCTCRTCITGLYAQDPAYKQVTKAVPLGTYAPNDIVTFEGAPVSKRIVEDLKKLLAAARRDGLELKTISGYCSYQRQ